MKFIFCFKRKLLPCVCNLLYLCCVKLVSPSEIILPMMKMFSYELLVTNLRVLCYDIYSIAAICTPYYQSRLNLVSEICLVNILTFSA